MRIKLKANIPEIVLGVFLTVAIFAAGMVFESSLSSPANDKIQQLSSSQITPEHAADKTTDWLLVALNFLLVVSTSLLWRANNRSAKIAESALTGLERPWLFLDGATVRRRDFAGAKIDTEQLVLGNRTNLADALAKGVATNRKAADAFAANVLPIVRQIQAAGATTHRAIAQALNDRGVRTARGGDWHDSTVRNLLARAR